MASQRQSQKSLYDQIPAISITPLKGFPEFPTAPSKVLIFFHTNPRMSELLQLLRQGSANCDLWPTSRNVDKTTCTCIAYGCFHPTKAGLSVGTETEWSTKPKIFTSYLFTESNCFLIGMNLGTCNLDFPRHF